jgi:hypothetical protein
MLGLLGMVEMALDWEYLFWNDDSKVSERTFKLFDYTGYLVSN